MLTTIVAALAHAGARRIGLTFLVAALATLQFVLPDIAHWVGGSSDTTRTTMSAVVFGLHGFNALVIAGTVGVVFLRARALAGGRG